MEPTPHAVSANAADDHDALENEIGEYPRARAAEKTRGETTPTDTDDTTVRVRTLRIRETCQPTVAATGSTNISRPKTNHSVRVG